MRRLFLFLLLSLPLFASAPPELSFITPSTAPRMGEPYTLGLVIAARRDSAPDVVVDWALPAGGVEWVDPRCVHRDASTWRCTIGALPVGTRTVLRADLVASTTDKQLESHATDGVSSVSTTITARTPSNFRITADLPKSDHFAADGSAVATFTVEMLVAPADIAEMKLSVTMANIADYSITNDAGCIRSETNVTCDLSRAMLPGDKAVMKVRYVPAFASQYVGGAVIWTDRGFPQEVTGAGGTITVYRDFTVTTTNDAGAGSLRQAMLDAAASCRDALAPCRIRFALPDDGAPWQTIRVLTPLPPLRGAAVVLDGTTARDTNPYGPDVVLDGSAMMGNAVADGLVTEEGSITIRGLGIESFPGNGIRCNSLWCIVERNYIGTDALGLHARGNALRGVSATHEADIVFNLISGNWRSGIFAETTAGFASQNRIGVAADGGPLANGASGIYIAPRAGFAADHNVIANNAHYGVAIAADQFRAIAGSNEIRNNALGAIDVGLDGPTPAEVPLLLSATYDPATDSTNIRGRIPVAFGTRTVHFYANDVPIGLLQVENEPEFIFRARGDLRGQRITANVVIHAGFPEYPSYLTTELSEAIPVQ